LFTARASWRFLALVVFIALVCLRLPEVIYPGRFWAEEGAVYYRVAWTMPWWQALWSPYVGYLNLAANAAGLAARYLVPLEDAPRVTTAIALMIQSIPAVLLVTAKDEWLRGPPVLFAAILLLAMPPVFDEVWLNTANSQFHIALAAALCLALKVPSGVGAMGRRFLLLCAPLSSPASVALTPLFIARAAIDRSKARALQAACIVTGTLLQLVLFYSRVGHRGNVPGPATLASIFAVKHLAIPFLGEQEAGVIANSVHGDVVAGHYPVAAILAVCVTAGLLLAAVIRRGRPEPAWLLVSGLAIACLSYYGAIEGKLALINVVASQRYAFAPSMLFALAVLALAATKADRIARVSWVVVIWLLAIATQQTLLPQDGFFVDGPSWKDEVALWRADPRHSLAIWPTGWLLVLPPQPHVSVAPK
jgi:hypothetical protein